MANRMIKQRFTSIFIHRCYTSLSNTRSISSLSSVPFLRPLPSRPSQPPASVQCFTSSNTTFSFSNPTPDTKSPFVALSPDLPDIPAPDDMLVLEGCDFKHWLIVTDHPEEGMTRQDIIDGYVKTLTSLVGSEEEARKMIYSVSTKHYYAFGVLMSEELAMKMRDLEKVRVVLPDAYLDADKEDYGEFSSILTAIGAAFSPWSRPFALVILANFVKKGLHFNQLIFSDKLPMGKQLVLYYSRVKGSVARAGIHGVWFFNIIEGNIVTYRRREPVSAIMFATIKRAVRYSADVYRDIRDKLWVPPIPKSDTDSGAVELQCYEYVKHNIYGVQEKVIDSNYLTMVPQLALPYLYQLPVFLKNYEALLSLYMKKHVFKPHIPLRLCEWEAKRCFGSRIRIAVKENGPDRKHLEFGFFIQPETENAYGLH